MEKIFVFLVVMVIILAFFTAQEILRFRQVDKTIRARNREVKRLARKNNRGYPFTPTEREDFEIFISEGVIQTKPFMEKDELGKNEWKVHAHLSDSAIQELWQHPDRH